MARSMAWETKKLALASVMCAAWCVSTPICQGADDTTVTPDTFACAEELLPCQEYMHITEEMTPSPSCCGPLKRVMSTDKKCVCAIAENKDFLDTLNVTKHDFRLLVSKCGVTPDDNYCKEYLDSSITRMSVVNPIEVTMSPHTIARSSSARKIAFSGLKTTPTMLPIFWMFFLRRL